MVRGREWGKDPGAGGGEVKVELIKGLEEPSRKKGHTRYSEAMGQSRNIVGENTDKTSKPGNPKDTRNIW